jgi:hypothetical protein
VQEGFDADIRLMTLYGLWAVRIKKGLAAAGIQRGSHVIEVCLCVTEALARRETADVIITYKTCRQVTIVSCYSAMPHD